VRGAEAAALAASRPGVGFVSKSRWPLLQRRCLSVLCVPQAAVSALLGKCVSVRWGMLGGSWSQRSCACGAQLRAQLRSRSLLCPPGWALCVCAAAAPHFPALSLTGCARLLDESQVTLSFQDWLASVTERIHQTMHYQFEGEAPGTAPRRSPGAPGSTTSLPAPREARVLPSLEQTLFCPAQN